ncbi:MAG: short-chain dehydrogenase [Frankiales bacterium]|nr:short-chain dehydrogenase [Frankiales bacterium]
MADPSQREGRKVAVVTGGGSGIGRAVALNLAGSGMSVVVSGRRPEALAEVVAQAAALPGEVSAFVADVTAPDSVAELFAEVRNRYGRLDLLFNNAGLGAPAVPLEELTFEQWRRVIDTNLTGAFLCTQEAFRIMKGQQPAGGRIINNGSLSAEVPRPFSAPYTASKHAITGLTKSTSLDGRAYGIACGQIDIGNADTVLVQRMGTDGALQPNGDRMVEPRMDVENVAQAVAYMAGLPKEANVLFLTVMATDMPFVGRG